MSGKESKGGAATITGDNVLLSSGTVIDASGKHGGGTIRIGGNAHGEGTLGAARNTTIAPNVTITADSLLNGNGGEVVVWADNNTDYKGTITARGGSVGGDGGFAEVSGKALLGFNGTVNLLAPKGETGELLLDPTNITISTAANSNVTGSSPYQPNVDDVIGNLNTTTLQTALASANVTVQTRATGSQAGNITVSNPITWAAANALSLTAANNIAINAAISGNTLNLSASGTVTQTAAITATNLSLAGTGGTYTLTNASNAITTLAANTDTVNFLENSGYDIGTVNSISGITATNTYLSTTGTVTQSQALSATNLWLYGVAATYTLNNANNAITTLAGGVGNGRISFREDSGYDIGTVNGANGIQAKNFWLTTSGTVTQSQSVRGTNLDLLGTGGVYSFTNTGNTFTTLAANTGTVSYLNNSGFDIGTVNGTVGVTATNAYLNSTGTVTQSQAIIATNLNLLGTAGVFTLTNTSNAITTLAADTGTVNFVENSGFSIGTVNGTTGLTATNAYLSSTGTVDNSGSRLINATNLQLKGTAGIFNLQGNNLVGTLAVAPGVTTLDYNSGGTTTNIGTVNGTNGITATNVYFDGGASDTYTQSQPITATNLLLKTAATYNLTNPSNDITTLAASGTSTVNLIENSGFAIGTVNGTIGLTATNAYLSSTGTVTQSQKLAATSVDLLGTAGVFTLTNTSNAITTLAADTGTVSFLENSGFAIGTVNGTVGLTATNAYLSSTGTVTQSQAIAATNLDLLGGIASSFTLTNTGNNVGTVAMSNGTVNLVNGNNNLAVGTVNGTVGITSSGNATLSAGTGTLTTSQAITAGGNLNLTADNMTIGANLSGSSTLTIKPSTTTRAINLNNGSTGLYLTTAELGYIQDGWFGITVGNSSDIGTLTLGAATWLDPVTFTSGSSGSTVVSGAQTGTGNASFTFSGPTTLSNNITTANQTILLSDAVTLGANSVLTSGTATITTFSTVDGAYNLTGTAGNFNFNGALGATTALGTVSLTSTSGFALPAVTATNLYLSNTGMVTQFGALTVTNLLLQGNGGIFSLGANNSNAITTFAANVGTGTVDIRSNSGFNLGTVNGVSGITATNAYLRSWNGATQSQAFSVSNLLLDGGAFLLSSVNNTIGTVAATLTSYSEINNTGGSSTNIGTVNGVTGITNTSVNGMGLNGNYNQTASITSPQLMLYGGGTFNLNNSGNNVGALSGNGSAAKIDFNNGSNNLIIGTTAPAFGLGGTNIYLASTGTVTQISPITATTLLLSGTGGTFTLTNTGNSVGTVAANTGSVNLVNGNNNLAVGTVNGTIGITNTGNTSLNTGTGTVTTTQAIATGAGNLTLTADNLALGANISGTGTVRLQPSRTNRVVRAADSNTVDDFNLTAAEIGYLQDGWSQIVIGRQDTSDLYTNTATWLDPVTFLGSHIAQFGTTTGTGNASFTFDNNGSYGFAELNGSIITAGQNVSFTDNNLTSYGGSISTSGGAFYTNGLNIATNNSGLSVTTAGGNITAATVTGGTGTAGTRNVNLNVGSGTIAFGGTADGDYNLTGIANSMNFNGAWGSSTALGTVSLTATTAMALPAITATNLYLSDTGTVTQTGAIAATNLQLAGTAGVFTLTNTGNAITTLAANTGTVNFLENSGYDIGTVNGTVGLTATNAYLSSTGTVTQSQALAATNLDLLGTAGVFTLTNTGNAITTLAGSTGTVNFLENSGFAIGTVNGTVGLTATNVYLSSTGTVTQSQAIGGTLTNLLLTGTGGVFTLTNSSNNIEVLAGNTGTINFKNNGSDSYGIGTVNGTAGVTATNVYLDGATNTVTQTQAIATTNLDLLGTGSTYTLTNTGNAITTLAANTGLVNLVNGNNNLAVGTVNGTIGITTTGNSILSAGTGTITTSQAIATGSGNLTLTADDLVIGATLTGTGTVTLQPASTSRIVCLNFTTGACAGANFGLSTAEIGYLTDGWSAINIGRSDSVAYSYLGATSWTDPVTFQSTTYKQLNGNLTGSGNASVTVSGGWMDVIGNITTANQNINFTNAGAYGFGGTIASNGGNINFYTMGYTPSGTSLTANSSGGNINISSTINTPGANPKTFTFNAGSGTVAFGSTVNGNADVTVTGGNIAFNGLWGSSTALNNITLNSTNSMALPGITATNLYISDTGTVTQTGAIAATNLQLAGTAGVFTLTNTGNAITTLAANTGTVNFLENSGYDIGTVNGTVGLTATNAYLSSTGIVTQSQKIAATNLLLQGTGGQYRLYSSGLNDITTLAAATGRVDLTENSGYDIGTVNGVDGVTVTDMFFTGGDITQSKALTAANVQFYNGDYTLTRSDNNVGTIAGLNAGTINLNNGSHDLVIGTVNTRSGITGTTNVYLTTTGNVSQTQGIAATNLDLLGTGGTFTLTNTGNNVGTVAANTGTVNLANGNNNLAVGTVNGTIGVTTTGNSSLSAGTGTITTSQAIAAGAGNFTLTADDLVLGANLSGTGTLTLQPASTSRVVNVNYGTADGTNFNLSTAEIAKLVDGWAGINIGLTGSTVNLEVGASTWTDPITFNNNYRMQLQGNLTGTGNASFTFSNAGSGWLNAQGKTVATAGGNITVNRSLVYNNLGTSALNSAGGNIILNDLTTEGSGVSVNSGGGNISLNHITVATASSAVTTLNAGTGTISFGNTVNTDGSVIATGSAITFGGAWGGSTALATASLTATSAMALPAITATNLYLSDTGAVTQTGAITATNLQLAGTGGTYTLTNTGNAITTLAANTGTVNFLENSGYDIGTVNGTVGVTATNAYLSSTGTVTQSQALAATNLDLLGTAGVFTLTNTGNAITTLASSTGTVNFLVVRVTIEPVSVIP